MNIILIGFRGTGKTTLGKIIAKKLNKKFADTDKIIEAKTGKAIQQIFYEKGEKEFRKIEKNIIKEISKKDNLVIATGGGVVLDKENIKNLKKNGEIIWLKSNIKKVHKRIKDTNRPSLTEKSKLEEIKYLIRKRKPVYKKYADVSYNTSNWREAKKEYNLDKLIKKLF